MLARDRVPFWHKQSEKCPIQADLGSHLEALIARNDFSDEPQFLLESTELFGALSLG
jgi:hypothetical protein